MEWILQYVKDVLTEHKIRATQLISRLLSMFLLGVFGFLLDAPEGMIEGSFGLDAASDAIALGVLAIVFVLLDLLIHRVRHGGIVRDKPSSAA